MIAFAKRNLKLYIRERGNLFFSMLSVIVAMGLYILFLGDVWTREIDTAYMGRRAIIDGWMLAGTIAMTSVSTTLGILGNMIHDKVRKIEKDFYIAPIKRVDIAGGYIISAYVVGVIMSLFTLLLGEIYLVLNGGQWLSVVKLLEVTGVILLASLMNTSMMLLVVSLFKSMNAYATASTIIGTLLGFFTGVYLPIGMYPSGVQWVIKLFPASHAALLLKNIMMEEPMKKVFDGAPGEMVSSFKDFFGIVYKYNTYEAPQWLSVGFMILTAGVCFGLAVRNIARKSK